MGSPRRVNSFVDWRIVYTASAEEPLSNGRPCRPCTLLQALVGNFCSRGQRSPLRSRVQLEPPNGTAATHRVLRSPTAQYGITSTRRSTYRSTSSSTSSTTSLRSRSSLALRCPPLHHSRPPTALHHHFQGSYPPTLPTYLTLPPPSLSITVGLQLPFLPSSVPISFSWPTSLSLVPLVQPVLPQQQL